MLTKILQHDFPQKWPDFMDITLQLLSGSDVNSVFAGLQCLLAICRVYSYKVSEKKAEFDEIVNHSFPLLLNIGSRLVDEESEEAGEMLRTVMKAYKHAIYVRSRFLAILRDTHVRTDRLTLFLPSARATRVLNVAPGHRRLVHIIFEDN